MELPAVRGVVTDEFVSNQYWALFGSLNMILMQAEQLSFKSWGWCARMYLIARGIAWYE